MIENIVGETNHSKEEILECLEKIQFGTVSTFDGRKIRSRCMHFATDKNFTLYFSTMKGDPKTFQIARNDNFSFLIHTNNENFMELREIEIIGRGSIVSNKEERNDALKLLSIKSPVVNSLLESNNTDILDVIRVKPSLVKYRIFNEIIRGIQPTIIQFDESAVIEDEYNWEKFGLDFLPRKIKLYLQELRIPFFVASIIPVILGSIIALHINGTIHWGYFLLTLIGGMLVHAGINVANDYFDHKSGNDEVNKEYIRPFSGGSRLIQKKLLTPKEIILESLVCLALGSSIGLYLTYQRGTFILLLGLIGIISGFFYSAPPFRFANRGIGELLVGINFGTIMCLGSYYVQTQSINIIPVIASIPVGLLIALVLYINEFPDFNADKSVGKYHLVVRLGREKAAIGYMVGIAMVYTAIIIGVFSHTVPVIALLSLLTFPMAIKAIKTLSENFAEPWKLFPANVLTIKLHLYIGLLLSLSYLI